VSIHGKTADGRSARWPRCSSATSPVPGLVLVVGDHISPGSLCFHSLYVLSAQRMNDARRAGTLRRRYELLRHGTDF
jgi:hypothetical protein